MIRQRRRTERLAERLTPRQRAVLLLEATKEDRAPNARVFTNVRSQERKELRSYCSLVDAMFEAIFPRAIAAHMELRPLELELAVVELMFLWALDRENLISFLREMSIEYCTANEFAARVDAAREQYVPFDDAVDRALDHRTVDRESPGDRRAVERELRAAMRQGNLQGHRLGKELHVNAGSLHDWLRLPLMPTPELGRDLRVGSADEVSLYRSMRADLERQLTQGPHLALQIHPALAPSPDWLLPEESLNQYDLVTRRHVAKLAEHVAGLRADCSALGAMLDEFAEVLEVDDAAHPRLRALMTDLDERLSALESRVVFYAGASDAEVAASDAAEAFAQLRIDLEAYEYFR